MISNSKACGVVVVLLLFSVAVKAQFNTFDPNGYYSSSSPRSQWIAVWVLWLIWAMLWIGRQVGGKPEETLLETTMVSGGSQAPPAQTSDANTLHWSLQMAKAENLAKDLFMTLFFALTVNAVARGSLIAANVLAWVYVFFAVCWIVATIILADGLFSVVRFAVGCLLKLIALVILILAYAWGWWFAAVGK